MIGKSLYVDRRMGSSIVERRILQDFRAIEHENLRTPRHNSHHRRRGRLDREGSIREQAVHLRTDDQGSNREQGIHLLDDHEGSNPERNGRSFREGSGDSGFDPGEGKRSEEVFSEDPATAAATIGQGGLASGVIPESGFRGDVCRRSQRKEGPVGAAGPVLSILAVSRRGEEPAVRGEAECDLKNSG
jgi:hypothetical protein